jgi:hypothetical protein
MEIDLLKKVAAFLGATPASRRQWRRQLDGGESHVLIVVSPDQPRPIVAVTEGSMPRSPFC